MQGPLSKEAIDDRHREKIAVIYQPHSRAVQDTPKLEWGRSWVIKWESRQYYKSPLMHHGTATEDIFSGHEYKVSNLKSAIRFAVANGHGYDIQMPKHKYHLRKAYIDNFDWKGEPEKPEIDDD